MPIDKPTSAKSISEPLALGKIETQLSDIEKFLINSKNVIQKLTAAELKDKDTEENEKKINSLQEQIQEKKNRLAAHKEMASAHDKEPIPELYTEQYKILSAAKETLEKEGKTHIINEIDPQKLLIALEFGTKEGKEGVEKFFELLRNYAKMSRIEREIRKDRDLLRGYKQGLLTYVDTKKRSLEFSHKLKSAQPLYVYLQITQEEKELAELNESLSKQLNLNNSHPEKPQSIPKIYSDLSALVTTATNLTLSLKALSKKISLFPKIDEHFELSDTSITKVNESLNQIQNDIHAANSQMTQLTETSKQYQTTHPSLGLKLVLPLTQLQKTLTQTSNLLDAKKQTNILNALLEADNNKKEQLLKLAQDNLILKTEKENRAALSNKYFGENQTLSVDSELGNYLEKRNKKYARRDAFFTCFPGSERAKRTAYLKDLSVLIKSYTEDDFKKGDESYLKLKEFIEQGIKDFKPRSNSSSQSLKFQLTALLAKIKQQQEDYTRVSKPLRLRQRL